MPTAKFHVPDLLTPDCEARLAARLLELPGVHGAVASRVDHCLEVDFEDDEAAISDLVSAGREAGFTLGLVG